MKSIKIMTLLVAFGMFNVTHSMSTNQSPTHEIDQLYSNALRIIGELKALKKYKPTLSATSQTEFNECEKTVIAEILSFIEIYPKAKTTAELPIYFPESKLGQTKINEALEKIKLGWLSNEPKINNAIKKIYALCKLNEKVTPIQQEVDPLEANFNAQKNSMVNLAHRLQLLNAITQTKTHVLKSTLQNLSNTCSQFSELYYNRQFALFARFISDPIPAIDNSRMLLDTICLRDNQKEAIELEEIIKALEATYLKEASTVNDVD